MLQYYFNPLQISTSNIYAGGSRLGGFDTGNTIRQNIGNLRISANTANNITFSIGSGSERMRIPSTGNVGIGKTKPQVTLDVSGSIMSTGEAINGTLNVSGVTNFSNNVGI